MGAARDPLDLPDVPAVAVCATCGDPSCPGHDFERSGERPIHRTLPWEDAATPPLRALFQTSIATATDLGLWIRASRGGGDPQVGPAFTFALACELLAVSTMCVPLAVLGAFVAWEATGSLSAVTTVVRLFAEIGAILVPLMLVIHVVHQLVVARAGGTAGVPVSRAVSLRAGLYACGWDLATGPLGVLPPLLVGRVGEARRRLAGNSNLYREATETWLRDVHGLEGAPADKARRATTPYMVGLLLVALVAVGAVVLRAAV